MFKSYTLAAIQAYVAYADVYVGEVTSDVRDIPGNVDPNASLPSSDGWVASAYVKPPAEAKDVTTAGYPAPA